MESRQGRVVRSLKLRLCLILSLIGVLFIAVVSVLHYNRTLAEARTYVDEEIFQIADILIDYDMPLPKRWSGPGSLERALPRQLRSPPPLLRQKTSLLPTPSLSDLFNRHRDIIIAPLFPPPGEVFYFPMGIDDGFYTLLINDRRVRSYVATNKQGIRFAVARPLSIIDEAVNGALRTSLVEFLVLIALYIPAVSLLVYFMFLPVKRLAGDIDRRRENDFSPLEARRVPSELDVFIEALNRLFAKTSDSLQNERRFIADAAHELRTPLAALTLQAEAIGESGLDAEARERLGELKKAVRRQRDLTESLLTYAKSQARGGHVDREFELKDLLVELIEELGPLADDKNIDFGVDGAVPRAARTDRGLLKTVLYNLAANAIKYTPAGGRVDLKAVEEGSALRIYVNDTGPGIPGADLARVFEPFYRVGADTAGAGGTGLGLAIVRADCAEIGADIRLENRPEGGLSACVSLRRCRTPAS